MGELRMDSRPFPAPLPHGNPVPFTPPPVSRLTTTQNSLPLMGASIENYFKSQIRFGKDLLAMFPTK